MTLPDPETTPLDFVQTPPKPAGEPDPGTRPSQRERVIGDYWALLTLVAFLIGSFGGYFANEQKHAAEAAEHAAASAGNESEMAKMARQVNPPDGYAFPASYGDTGPKLLSSGAINYDAFVQVYEQAGNPLGEKELAILKQGSSEQIVINKHNAHFLLNYFWALGLTNRNSILTEGPMVQNSGGQIENFASTGGWSIAAKPIKELYASTELVTLTDGQQDLVEKVAQLVYRPCCNNPAHFPDCNHGMAMLGLLELLAAGGAGEEELFEAAKYANAYWYPSQSIELAMFFQSAEKTDFAQADAQQVVSGNFSSASGFQSVHQWLGQNGLLEQAPSGSGGSCGV